MRFLQSLVLGLLPLTAFAAKKPTADRFADFHKKGLTSAPIKLTDSVYDKLTSSPRDYSVAVLLTALEQRFGCQLCREFQAEWELLAKSWTKGDNDGESRLVYGTLDFSDGKATFQSVGYRTELTRKLDTDMFVVGSSNRSNASLLPSYFWTRRCTRWSSFEI